jgi:retron-type reverse transcriptase
MAFLKFLFGDRSRGAGVDELARRLGIVENDLLKIQPSYQKFAIPKKSGGTREILAPSKELKVIQRRILSRLLARLAVHPDAKGFRRGHSVIHNALPHTGKAVVIRMDLKNFFSSTKSRRVEAYFKKIGWNGDAAALLTKLCTWQGALPQGAPTSPCLSNVVNYKLDARLAGLAKKHGAAYTRYADDITFSLAQDSHTGIVSATKQIVADEGYELHVHKKLRIRRKHQQQRVTGLVVNHKVTLPRKTRRWLRAVEHRLKNGEQATIDATQLAGWKSLRQMIQKQAGK